MPGTSRSTVLTIRVPTDLHRRIAQTARRRRSTTSAVLREALDGAFGSGPEPDDPAREARRQSLLVRGRPADREALDFVTHAADDRGWR
jgi:predicted transcriptional regulator